MIRLFAAAAALAVASLAGAASAQTWGQPIYVGPYGRVIGGTPLSEVETRSYVTTGRWADGYTGQAYVYVPAPVYGERYGRAPGYAYGGHGYGYGRYDHGRYGYDYGRRQPRPDQGYRDEWGYNDDRPPSARGWSDDRGYRRDRRHDRDCGCADVYLYDR